MDIVITYVNGLDPVWLQSYAEHTKVPIMTKRFRDWGFLPYLFRGIEQNMPFVRNVYLVVSGDSQVPEWIDRDHVKVVHHENFVPKEYLPTFNCNPLEMYLHRIEGLDEHFLYFNDDMFPMLPCTESDFFRDGKSVIHFSSHRIVGGNMYKQICKNSDTLVRDALGLARRRKFIRPQHICSPMQKSRCEELFEKVEDSVKASITITRTADNYNQYMYLDYLYYKGLIVDEKISNKHISVAFSTPGKVSKFIKSPTRKLVCINDVHLGEKHYLSMRKAITDAFESRFPNKSKYEL